MSSYILEVVCSSKHPLSSVNFFCFSHLKKKRSHIRKFSDGIERLFEGYSLIKSLQMNTIPLKLTKKLQSTLIPRKHAIRWISNYSPAKMFNDNSYNLYECFDNHPIKITPGFWIVTSLNSVSAQLPDVSLRSLRLYKPI